MWCGLLSERSLRFRYKKIVGLDINPRLVEIANKNIPNRPARVTTNIYESLRESEANIIAAFYVLEHI